MGKKESDPDEIYRFLGFGIHPGKLKDFWESEGEEKKYVKKVESRGGRPYLLDREDSMKNANLMTAVDKTISIIGGAILILAFFLPIYSIDPDGKAISGSGISYLLHLPFVISYAFADGAAMILAFFLFTLILLTCPVAGILNILGLFNKNRGDEYLSTIKKYNRFTYLPIFLYLILIMVLIFGAPNPFGSLGINALGDTLNFASIFTMTGYGFWLNIAGLLFGFAQSRGI